MTRTIHGAIPATLVVTLAVALVVLGGCGGGSSTLGPYAQATLTAGTGLGDLALRTTTLQPFLARFGTGVPSFQAGDEFGIELRYPEGASFLFALEGACRERANAAPRDVIAALRDPAKLLAAFPECAGAPLRSVALAGSWWKGRTDAGVALSTTRAEALAALGPAHDVRGLWLAGESPMGPAADLLAWKSGLALWISEAQSGPAKGHLVVTKVAIFPAE